MKHFALPALALISAVMSATAASAQPSQILVCSNQPGGTPALQIDLDYGGSRVFFNGQWATASFSDREITWSRPRYEPGGGTVIVAARYRLDRVSGVLTSDHYCLARDQDWCMPSGSPYYCAPGQKRF